MTIMIECEECGTPIDRTKDFYITINERKERSRDFCSPTCVSTYLKEESAWESA